MEPGEITNLQIALEPRMMFDGAAVATAAQVAENAADNSDGDAQAAADNGDGEPTVSGTESEGLTASVDKDGSSSFQKDLFSGVSADLEGGYEFSALKITVSSADGGQALVAEGTTIDLSDGNKGSIGPEEDIQYTISKNGSGGFDIVFTFDEIQTDSGDLTPERLASLVDSLQYKITDGKALAENEVKVKIDSLTYNYGDTITFGLEAVITIDSEYNHEPELVQGGALSIVEQATMQGFDIAGNIDVADDGKSAVAMTNTGDIVRFALGEDGKINSAVKLEHSAITDLGTVKDVQVSADGRNIYLLNQGEVTYEDGSTSPNTSVLHVIFSEDTGTLSFSDKSAGAGGEAFGLSLSADGKYVSLICVNGIYDLPLKSDGSFVIISDIDNQRVTDTLNRGPIISSGNLLFQADKAQNGVNLTVFIRGTEGKLQQLQTLMLDGFASFYDAELQLSVSADGTRLAVLSAVDGENLMAIYDIGADGQLTQVMMGNTPGSAEYRDAALSKDGSTLYLLSTDGTKVEQYQIGTDGTLSQSAVVEGLKDVSELSVNASTGDVYAAGSLISRLSDKLTMSWGKGWHFPESFHDAELDRGSENYNGASITISASVSDGEFDFSAEGYSYDKDTGNVAVKRGSKMHQ